MNRRDFIQGAIVTTAAMATIPLALAVVTKAAPIIPSEVRAAASVYGLAVGDLVSYDNDCVYRVTEIIDGGLEFCGVRLNEEFAWSDDWSTSDIRSAI